MLSVHSVPPVHKTRNLNWQFALFKVADKSLKRIKKCTNISEAVFEKLNLSQITGFEHHNEILEQSLSLNSLIFETESGTPFLSSWFRYTFCHWRSGFLEPVTFTKWTLAVECFMSVNNLYCLISVQFALNIKEQCSNIFLWQILWNTF